MKPNKLVRLIFIPLIFSLFPNHTSGATKVFDVPYRTTDPDHTSCLRKAIMKAARWQVAHSSDSVVVRLREGVVYNISRENAVRLPYYVSNTTSNEENPGNPYKHVGVLFKNLKNFTFDGNGATLLTHGEMTPWVIDSCANITIRSLSIDACDPSVPEMTVTEGNDTSFVAQTNIRSAYVIKDKMLYWCGHGWEFGGGIAQYFSPADSITMRCTSPLVAAKYVEEIAPGVLRFVYPSRPMVEEGTSFQMRHSFRTEVAGLITQSSNITLEGLNLRFMGNFGIVAQTSSDLKYLGLVCAPDTPVSGRHNAGFADFLQVSGCRGEVVIDGCTFAGAHDDPINIHGTHLSVDSVAEDGKSLMVSYRHPQTFGFQSFFGGDTVAFVNPHTLLEVGRAVVKNAAMLSPHKIEITLAQGLPQLAEAENLVIENISWCPSVRITNNSFTLTPTRAILVTTRRPVEISGNRFVRIPMASILVADDGRSWYESGPVHNLTVSHNDFIDCSAPQILIAPENDIDGGAVHHNVAIESNRFIFSGNATPFGKSEVMIKARSVDGLRMKNNGVEGRDNLPRQLILESCSNIMVDEF